MTQTSPSLAADPLDSLLEKLGQGDPDAAEEVFRAYEPYLRLVVRRQLSENLRAKFDSMDIVQSVWADVLVGFRRAAWNFQDAAHLKAFLVRVAKHRLIDRFRQHHRAIEHERSFNSAELEAFSEPEASRPSAEVHADELWQQMLEACPPAHRPLLGLKRQGLSLDEIASRTGLHKSSVRRILYDVAQRLAHRQATEQSRLL
jgi:RNA polymerase sigma-70 factor (ECF subfamily)